MSNHKPVGLPKMFMFQGRVRCDCEAGEILTESVMLPWDTPREHVHWMVDKLLDAMKAEALQHLVRQRAAPAAGIGAAGRDPQGLGAKPAEPGAPPGAVAQATTSP